MRDRRSSRRLNQAREPLLENWVRVSIGLVTRNPNRTVKTGNKSSGDQQVPPEGPGHRGFTARTRLLARTSGLRGPRAMWPCGARGGRSVACSVARWCDSAGRVRWGAGAPNQRNVRLSRGANGHSTYRCTSQATRITTPATAGARISRPRRVHRRNGQHVERLRAVQARCGSGDGGFGRPIRRTLTRQALSHSGNTPACD